MRFSYFLPIALGLFLLAGCSSYQLGNRVELPFDTIYVEPVVNRALAPQAEVVLADQIISDLNQSGRVKTAQPGADATLSVTLVDFQKAVTATRAQDTQEARAFEMVLTAYVTLTDNRSGEVLLDQKRVFATQQVFTDGGLIQAEFQAMPVLTRKLANRISNQVLGAW